MNLTFRKDDLILIWAFYVLPFADLLTGMLLSFNLASEGGLASPSQIFRMALLLAAATRLRKKNLAILACVLITCTISEYLGSLVHQSFYGLGIGIANMFKIAYICCMSMLFSMWVMDGTYCKKVLLKYALNGAVIYAVNIVLAAMFGFGEKTYGPGTFGTKGFVPSNNGLSMTLGSFLLLSVLANAALWERLRSLILLLGTLLIGAKASIIFVLVYLFVNFYRLTRWLKLIVISGIVVAYVNFFNKITASASIVFDVVVYRFKNSNGNILHFAASGRDDYIRFAFGGIRENVFGYLRTIFGMGAYVSFHDVVSMMPLHLGNGLRLMYETLETDAFDIYFQYGVVMSLAYFVIAAFVGYSLIRYRQWILLLNWTLICMFSAFAGHTIFNGMSATAVFLIVGISCQTIVGNKDKKLIPRDFMKISRGGA